MPHFGNTSDPKAESVCQLISTRTGDAVPTSIAAGAAPIAEAIDGPSRNSPGPGRPSTGQGPSESNKADTINVDQIVREIKARIAQRHGIDLSSSQIQELAARRLEAILDPRSLKPSLLDQLRQNAGAPAAIAPVEPAPAYEFQDHTIFDTHNGLLRALRNLLKPILKLFFNPNPIAHALNAQARLNKEAASRELERERTQSEWNALHYTLVQRLVTEIARTSIETQSLALRVESLSTRVDHYERRVRELEQGAQPASPQPQQSSEHRCRRRSTPAAPAVGVRREAVDVRRSPARAGAAAAATAAQPARAGRP